jgi:hypothetical protein
MLGDQLWPVVAAGAVFCWLVVTAYARPTWVVGLAVGLFAGEATFGAAPGMEVGGIVVYGQDAVFLALLTGGAGRFLLRSESRTERPRVAGWAWWPLLLLALWSLLRGVQAYGANLAGNDFRPTFYLLAGVVGLAAQPKSSTLVRDVADVWIGVALVLVAVGMARSAGLTIGLPVGQQPFLNGRPLYAWPTLFIAQAALLSFFAVPLKSRWAALPGLPYLFMIAVLLFRHRTVWAAMAISVVAMWTMLRPDRSVAPGAGSRHWAGVLVGAAVLIVVLLSGSGASLERDLATTTQTATSPGSTFIWRVEGWKALLDAQGANPHDLALGIPYGAGYHREVFDAEVEYSPHSWYVQTISRVGVLGCGLMILALVELFRRGRAAGLLPRNLGALLVLSTVVYGIAYYPPEVEGILLGLVFMSARHRSPTVRPEEALAGPVTPELAPTTR